MDTDAVLNQARETINSAETMLVLKRATDLLDELLEKRVGAQLWGSSGGKSRIANRLIPLFPEHKTYVEAFAGGAAVFWAKTKEGTEVLNDMDDDIAGALKFVQGLTDAQVAELKRMDWKATPEHHKKLKASNPTSPAARFHRMVMLRFGTFMRDVGKPNAGIDGAKMGKVVNVLGRIAVAKERLAGVKIHHDDYRKVIEKYDGPDAFFFLDPPYTKTDQSLGERGFDHKAFWAFLSKLKGKFMVTYDAPDPDKKFNLQILEHKTTDSRGGSSRVYKTHVITNYKTKRIEAKKSIVTMDGFDIDGNAIEGFDDDGCLVEKQVPKPDASTEDKRKAQRDRSREFGIEALEGKGERLTFPKGFPTELRLWADPVNILYPLDLPGRARNARARFKQFAQNYEKEASRRIVHTRIVERLLEIGAKPSYDEDDPLDKLLPAALKDKLKELAKQEATQIQTLILSKDKFKTLEAARKWVREHDFKTLHAGKGPDETENSWRFRQRDPGDFQEGSFRTIDLPGADGVKAVIGRPKTTKRDDDEEREVSLLPIEKAAEEMRIVFGVVLEPNKVDAQNDTISPEEIEQTAHEWLAKYQNRGFMHRKLVNGKIEIYESYIAPVDMTIGGQKVKKGTWLLMYHVKDDEIWQQIKSGKLTGFSMGGFARRVPAKAA